MATSDLVFDAASVQAIGCRSRQEDALVMHFCERDDLGIAVLSDGMGGHEDGDLASRIIAGEMFGALFLSSARRDLLSSNATAVFGSALNAANQKLRQYIDAGHINEDTGGTLASLVIRGRELRWLSVGDSPFYRIRDGEMTRLNEDHSMARQIDLLVEKGQLDAEAARNHAHRNCLTSAVTGKPIPRVDCPEKVEDLRPGDILLLASDGVNSLSDTEICNVLMAEGRSAEQGALALIDAVADRNMPEQDNTSIVVVRVAECQPQVEVAPVCAPECPALAAPRQVRRRSFVGSLWDFLRFGGFGARARRSQT